MFRFEKILRNDVETIPLTPESFRIPAYLLSGPQVIRKEIQQQKCKDLETPPEGPTLHLERGWDHFPDPSFSESSFKLLGKIGYSTRDFQTIWRLRISPWLMCWGSRSPAKGPERSQQEGWFFAGNREATNAEFGDSWSLPPVFRLVLLGSCFNVVPCCLPWTFKTQKSIVWGLQFSVDPRS